MSRKNLKADIEALHRRATGSVKPRGAVTWAADALGVTRQTVHNWLAGKGEPTAAQVMRLQVVASIDERARLIRADRLARRGPWRSLSQWLSESFKDDVTAAAEQRADERAAAQTRANRAFQPPPRRSWLRSRSWPR